MQLDPLKQFFETLTPESVARMGDFYTEDATFRDPFNEVKGLPAIERVFAKMWESLDDPRFVIVNVVEQGNEAFLEWDFLFTVKRLRSRGLMTVRGVSHLRFAADGRVQYHRDFWDAASELYAKLPVIGGVMRWLARKMA
jgi:ketosteroid isomerase-like protein